MLSATLVREIEIAFTKGSSFCLRDVTHFQIIEIMHDWNTNSKDYENLQRIILAYSNSSYIARINPIVI